MMVYVFIETLLVKIGNELWSVLHVLVILWVPFPLLLIQLLQKWDSRHKSQQKGNECWRYHT